MSMLDGATVLCGAGISRLAPSNLPDGELLSRRLIELVLDGPVVFPDDAFDAVFTALRPRGDGEQDLRLELVFELLAQEVDPRILVGVFTLLEGAEPNPNHFALLLSDASYILTLNQDVLLEEAAHVLGQGDAEDRIVHLHGRCDRPETVVTLISEYLAGLPTPLWELMQNAATGRRVIVVGYSGRDRDVMPALAKAKPREVRWIQHSPDGTQQPLSTELATLQAELGPRLIIHPEPDPGLWLRRQFYATSARHFMGQSRPARISADTAARFAKIDERSRNLALGRLLRHIGQLEALHAGLKRLRRRRAGRHPDVELMRGAVLADMGARHRAARLFAEIARSAGDPETICQALLWRAEALSNQSDYGGAREALTKLRRSARRLPAKRRIHYLAWATEREARMKGMTDQEGGALRDYARARRLFDSIHDIDGSITARTFAADILRSRGRYRQALQLLDQALNDGDLFARSYYKPWPRFYHGILLASMGDLDDGLAELEFAETMAVTARNLQAVAWIAVLRACFERARNLRAADEALAVAIRAIGKAERRMSLVHARVLFERAELARARGDAPEVRRRLRVLRQWITHSVPGKVPYLVTHADAVEAELARDLDNPRAADLLATVVESYREQGATACHARLATSLWLVKGGKPPGWLVALCRREGFGFELRRLEGTDTSNYYPLHVL